MVTYEWYKYIDTGFDLSADLPENTRLIIQLTSDNLIYVEATTQVKIYHFNTTTGTETQLDVDPSDTSGDNKSRDHKIQALYHDRTNQIIWGADCDNDGTADDYDVWKLDYSVSETSPTVTEIGSSAGADANSVYVYDIWMYDGDTYVTNVEKIGGNTLITVRDVDTAPFVYEIGDGVENHTTEMTTGVLNGDMRFSIYEDEDDDEVRVWYYDVGADTSALNTGISGYQLPSNYSQRGVICDGNYLYFNAKKTADGKIYNVRASIPPIDGTTVREERDCALMSMDETQGTPDSPMDYPKYFHISSSFVYRLSNDFKNLLKIADLELTGGATIVALTDTFLIDSNKNVYKYTESISKLHSASAAYNVYNVPQGAFALADKLATDQLIEIYENNAGTYTLCFRGKLGRATYNKRTTLYEYRMGNLGYNDLQESVSYTASAEGIDEVVLALIGQLSNPYIYADATSVPNIATNMTYVFDDVRLIDALYVCCILGNAYFWVEPDGYLYFRAYSNPPASGDTYSNSAGNMGNPDVDDNLRQYNDFSSVRGGWDSSSNGYFTPTSPTNSEHIQEFGPMPWEGKSLFAGATTQASLDAIITGLKAWQGMDENPFDAAFVVKQYYYPVGYKCNVQWTLNSLISSATDMIIKHNLTNFKKPNLITIGCSTNIVW